MDNTYLSRWVRHPLTALTGVVAFIYGVGFAFGLHERFDLWVWGAAVVGVLFVASLVAAAATSGRDPSHL